MRDLRLDPGDIGDIALAYQWLVDQPYVDPTRSGLLGTCVGGSFALMAAAHPHVRDRVGFVAAFAPYSSMGTLVRDIASSTRDREGMRVPWQVDQLTRKVFVRTLTSYLEPGEAELLRAAFPEGSGHVDVGMLSADGRAVCAVLGAMDPLEAQKTLDRLPGRMREKLDLLSPMSYLGDLQAPVIVFGHDREDSVIPVEESRRLLAALSGRAGVHYTEFDMFQHADPTKRKLPVRKLARELGKFYRYAYPMFRQAVASHPGTVRPTRSITAR
jgi:dienelactone hydrolase